MAASKKIILGSGKLYVKEWTGTLPEDIDTEMETDSNLFGFISGGCSVAMTPEFTTVEDDLQYIVRSVITSQSGTLSAGILTLTAEALKKLDPTAGDVTEDTEKKSRELKLGSLQNYQGQKYLLHFVHDGGKEDNTIRITAVGMNQAGWTLQFNKSDATTVNAEFKLFPCDDDGTLVIYKETDPETT